MINNDGQWSSPGQRVWVEAVYMRDAMSPGNLIVGIKLGGDDPQPCLVRAVDVSEAVPNPMAYAEVDDPRQEYDCAPSMPTEPQGQAPAKAEEVLTQAQHLELARQLLEMGTERGPEKIEHFGRAEALAAAQVHVQLAKFAPKDTADLKVHRVYAAVVAAGLGDRYKVVDLEHPKAEGGS